jgi:hypothetical protein
VTWRTAGAVAFAVAAHGSGTCGCRPGDAAPVVVHGHEGWYRERPERETRWRGTLRRRDPPQGPGVRTALTLSLRTSDEDLPVYAAGVGPTLAPFVGSRVVVTAKLIDLRSEGQGRELWVGTIQREGGDRGPREVP